jgi:succinate dehydrogenase / fumarate reductase cytochrome b subunit
LNQVLTLYQTSLGKKYIMAFTGLIGVGFVVMHMLGNMQVFLGREKLNHYAELLRAAGGLLWFARAVLLTAVVTHIIAALQLTRQSQLSRPVSYQRWRPTESTYASRTMRWSGPILALFIVYHLLHFTAGTVHPNFIPGDVYHNVISGFQVPYVSAFYIISMVALGLHMNHGIWSMFQSLGANNSKYSPRLRLLAALITLAVVAGNISVPVAVLAGLIK